jgi:coenzyme PQQ precursor peptide PqqA
VKQPRWSNRFTYHNWSGHMSWTKPEAEVVAVTMEVTAYVATL